MGLSVGIGKLLDGHTVDRLRLSFEPTYDPDSSIHAICVFANQSEKSVYVRLGSLNSVPTKSQLRDLYDQCQIIRFDDRYNPYIELSDISLSICSITFARSKATYPR